MIHGELLSVITVGISKSIWQLKKTLRLYQSIRLWNVKHARCSAEPWTATFQFEDTLLFWVKYICSSSPYKSHLFTIISQNESKSSSFVLHLCSALRFSYTCGIVLFLILLCLTYVCITNHPHWDYPTLAAQSLFVECIKLRWGPDFRSHPQNKLLGLIERFGF